MLYKKGLDGTNVANPSFGMTLTTQLYNVLYCHHRFYFVAGVIQKEGLVSTNVANHSFGMTLTIDTDKRRFFRTTG